MADDTKTMATDANSDPWIGQTLAGYIVLRRLGEGGMGIIYLARHQSLDRLAAVKFLPGDMATNTGFVELFLREAKAAAKLSHPNIVAVYDAGVVGENIYYFIMEYVEGRDLHSMLEERGTLPVAQAADYTMQAATALAYAHRKGIIHRDIKPQNLLLTEEGVIKVVDLGLAKWTGEESSMLTQTGEIMGSPVYISPERLRDPSNIDARTDIYSLGGTLFHLVTGRIPYEGSSPVIMARHLSDPVPEPREIKPELDENISIIIKKMMAKEPADRFQTMEEVESALEAYFEGKSSPAPAGGKAVRFAIPALIVAIMVAGYFLAPFLKNYNKSTQSPISASQPPASMEPSKSSQLASATHEITVADFNNGEHVNNLTGAFGHWASEKPQGHASEDLRSTGGPDGSGCWRINFDITNPGSYSGAWMQLNDLDVSEYTTLSFNARADELSVLSFIVEIKAGSGKSERIGRQVVSNVGTSWQKVEIPIRAFNLAPQIPLSGLNFVFDGPATGAKKGILLIDDIRFTRKE